MSYPIPPIVWRLAAGVCCALFPLSLWGAEAPGDGAYELSLGSVLEGGRPLVAHLRVREGRITAAWGASTQSNTAYALDAAGLALDGGRIRGELSCTVHNILHRYDVTVDSKGNQLAGSYKGASGIVPATKPAGALSGEVAAVAHPSSAAFDLRLAGGLPGMTGAIAEVGLTFTIRDGKAMDAAVVSTTGRKPAPHWAGKVKETNLAFDGERLTGGVTAVIDPTVFVRTGGGEYVIALEAKVHGNLIIGSFKTRLGQRQVASDRFAGTSKAVGEPKDKSRTAYTLVVEDAVDGVDALRVHLDRREGGFGSGAALAAKVAASARSHSVDASGLKLVGDALKGTLKVKVDAGGWSAAYHRPVACEITVDAAVKDGVITGTHSCVYVPAVASGTVSGQRKSWEQVAAENTFTAGKDFATWRGPYGNGTAVPSGHALVESLADARLVWRSEAKLPDSWYWKADPFGGMVGGYGSPMVADGRVYVQYYLPSGPYIVEAMRDADCRDAGRWRDKFRIDADDVLVCIDGATGRTLWQNVYAGKGLNYNSGRSGPFLTPCVADGRVYAIGSAGRVYCVDAPSSTTLWEGSLGPATDKTEAIRQESRKAMKMPRLNLDFCGAPLLVDGVLVCNDNEKGLIGLDPQSGRKVWGPIPDCTTKSSSPVRWRHRDKNYVIVGCNRVVCIDPREGKIIWEAPDAAAAGTVALWEDYMVCAGGEARGPDNVKKGTGLSAFRIDLSGAKLLWDLGPRYTNHVTCPVIYKGHVYGFWEPATLCVEVATGKIVGTAEFPGTRGCSSLLAADGRIIREHLYQRLYWYDADPKNFRQLGSPWTAPSNAENITSTIVDGRLLMRGKDCLWCYDLRKAGKPTTSSGAEPTPAEPAAQPE